MRKAYSVRACAIIAGFLVLCGAPPRKASAEGPPKLAPSTVYRDEFGIPHVFAPTLESAAYAIGHAQAEDRLEELLKNYRRAAGTMAEVFGPELFEDDLQSRVWRHQEISKKRYDQVGPKMRAVLEAYVAGVKRFMKDHPDQVPAWAQEIHPWDAVALGRYIIWGWPLGEAVGELKRAGVQLTPPAARGSNEVLIAPSRSALKAPIAIVDPHLSWYGPFRFYQERIYVANEDFNVAGVGILGQPIPSLGHSRYCSIAMTTGGPDTSDVYVEETDPDHPRRYRYDGAWREMTVRTYTIGVKEGDAVKKRTIDVEYTHHGPVVARAGNKAYTVAIPYINEIGLADQIYEMMKAHNLDEMKRALGRLQLMAQNVMVGTVQGDIYYVRNGRVPIRAPGVDPSRPVPGDTSATEWKGLHSFSDLVQITNPPGGWMQNCNCSPAAMMTDSPMVPSKYKDRPYLFNEGAAPTHQRAQMMSERLAGADHVTIDEAIDIAFNPRIYRAERWQARIKKARSNAKGADLSADTARVAELIARWDRRCDAGSTGGLAFYAFKLALGKPVSAAVDPPKNLTDDQVLEALKRAVDWLKTRFGSVEVPYGRYFRVGRAGGERNWPVGGGTLKDQGMATPRAISFGPTPDGKLMIGHGGQTSTQIIIMTDPPQSFSIVPLGASDHKNSGHWDDQAEKLFSKSHVAFTYFMNKENLLKHVTKREILNPE